MNFSNIKDKIKEQINSSADKMLSSRVKDELGFNKPTIDSLMTLSESPDVESNLNSFYKPVNSTFLSGKDYKNIQKWVLLFITIIAIALLFLFASILLPNQDYSNSLDDSQVVIDGNQIDSNLKAEAKIEEPDDEDLADLPSEELQVENITINSSSAEKLAKQSPLLQSNNVTLVEYKIKSGDSLEIIAQKFYGNTLPSTIDKIKVANKIRNVRLIQVGQKIIIPM